MTTTLSLKPLLSLAAASALAVTSSVAVAQSSAASQCPGYSISPTNVAVNPGFEQAAANVPMGETTCWQNGNPQPMNSAAAGWQMHTSNVGARVCSRLIDSTTPGPNGNIVIASGATASTAFTNTLTGNPGTLTVSKIGRAHV